MPDVTELIMDDHTELRRQFAALDDARGDTARLAEIWEPLATLLDLHAETEEQVFYPSLLKKGENAEDETEDAIDDHNKIRDAVAEAGKHDVGTDAWWQAVEKAREENSDHIAEEEREALPDFRKNAPDDLRDELGGKWQQFRREHKGGKGLDTHDKDPDDYIEANS